MMMRVALASLSVASAFVTTAPRREVLMAKRVDAAGEEKRSLHPLADVLEKGYLPVSDGHEIFYEVRGRRPDLPMALWLHGGPGAGCFPNHARFCDPKKWRVALVDQRGCGRSRPTGDVSANTTPLLVDDLEALRHAVNDGEPWACVVGGSWGSTLALAYAQAHPSSLRAIVLRGVCAMRTREIRWLFSPSGGAAAIAPHAWKRFADLAGDAADHDDAVLLAYYDMLRSDDDATRRKAASSWQRWEFQASAAAERRGTVVLRPTDADRADAATGSRKRAPRAGPPGYLDRLEAEQRQSHRRTNAGPQPLLTCHYSVHRGFLDDGAVLRRANVDKIRHLPAIAVQGGADLICPPVTAYDLAAAWPELELRLVHGAAHSQYDPDIKHELLDAIDKVAALLAEAPAGLTSASAPAR